MAASKTNLQLLRQIIRELRLNNYQGGVRSQPAYAFISDQFRRHQVTSRKVCRGESEMRHLGQTYACMLESLRKQQELSEMYKGHGERSIEQSANLVGLSLPKAPERDK